MGHFRLGSPEAKPETEILARVIYGGSHPQVLWAELCPPSSCVEVLTPSTSECHCIWRWVSIEVIPLKGGAACGPCSRWTAVLTGKIRTHRGVSGVQGTETGQWRNGEDAVLGEGPPSCQHRQPLDRRLPASEENRSFVSAASVLSCCGHSAGGRERRSRGNG